jgi:hypothetical protein
MFILHTLKPDGSLDRDLDERPGHSTTARRIAKEAAEDYGQRVQVSRMRSGKLAPAYMVQPDGSVTRPLTSKPVSEREDCKAPRVCFCSPCRARRRA